AMPPRTQHADDATRRLYKTRTRAERAAQIEAALHGWSREAAPGVQTLAPTPSADIPLGNAVSQGAHAHAADRARRIFVGADGTGVKIGVLSDSDDNKEQSIASGDLPADTVTVPGQDGRPGSGEGTAMMEIVHDVAPGAQIFFATAFNSEESFAD